MLPQRTAHRGCVDTTVPAVARPTRLAARVDNGYSPSISHHIQTDMPMNHARLHHLRHWIFDMDGTLTVASHDFPLMRRQLGMADGDLDILAYVARQSETDAQAMRQWLWDYEVDLAKNAEPATGAVGLVEHLHAQDKKLAILTRNDRKLAHITLDAIGLLPYFDDQVVYGRDEAEPKPSPHGITQILHHWQAANDDTIMVGDYLYDVSAGRNAGTHTMLINHVDNHWPELSDYYFVDCGAVLGLLQQEQVSE